MTEPSTEGLVLRETLVFDESGTFRPGDYPWLVKVRAYIRTAGAGHADGTAGEPGSVRLEMYGRGCCRCPVHSSRQWPRRVGCPCLDTDPPDDGVKCPPSHAESCHCPREVS